MSDPFTLAPGIYYDLPFADYLALDACSSTELRWMERSPAYCRYKRDADRQDTDATRLGSVVHAMVLEPHTFEDRYVVEPVLSEIGATTRGSKAYKSWRASLDEGIEVVKRGDYDRAKAMLASIEGHPECRGMLRNAGAYEVTLVWERDGLLCKGRVDKDGKAGSYIGDLKTTKDLPGFSPWVISRYFMPAQAEWYLDGFRRLGEQREFAFIAAVANDPPHECELFRLDDESLRVGAAQNAWAFERWAKCVESGYWPAGRRGTQDGNVTQKMVAEWLPEEA